MNIWDNFARLHPAVQVTLVIGILSLFIVIAFNHTAEENLVNLLLAFQSIALNNKIPNDNRSNQGMRKEM